MTTQTLLKADLADDLDRTDLTSAIANAITSAITFYQRKRFWFNESRESTFATVASQAVYSVADDADIENFYEIDLVTLTNGGRVRSLTKMTIEEWEIKNDNSASSGEPYQYAYFNKTIYLYPIPNAAYTVRLTGHIKVAAPATDGEADNHWMTDGYSLIRFRARWDLCLNKIRDIDFASTAKGQEQEELSALEIETERRKRTGIIKATLF